MTKDEIVAQVKALDLPVDAYVVFGSGPLAAAGLREAGDIDLYVTPALLERFRQEGWQQVHKGKGDAPYVKGTFEAHANWDFSSYRPSFAQIRKSATLVDGIPFAALEEVRKWKAASGRPKDFADIALIDDYFVRR